jgi:hypothetical protein
MNPNQRLPRQGVPLSGYGLRWLFQQDTGPKVASGEDAFPARWVSSTCRQSRVPGGLFLLVLYSVPVREGTASVYRHGAP